MVNSDGELVVRTLRGEREAFGELVDRHQRAVYALAIQRGCSSAEAEDVAQEAFWKAFRDLHRLKDAGHFESWLYGIVVHVAADQARAAGRERARALRFSKGREEVAAEGPEAGQGAREEREEMLRLLSELTPEQQVVLTLRYVSDLTPKQIAERLGEPRGTIRSRLHHALAALQRRLSEQTSLQEHAAGAIQILNRREGT